MNLLKNYSDIVTCKLRKINKEKYSFNIYVFIVEKIREKMFYV